MYNIFYALHRIKLTTSHPSVRRPSNLPTSNIPTFQPSNKYTIEPMNQKPLKKNLFKIQFEEV